MKSAVVYGIGNPLIDLNYQVSDATVSSLGLTKGVMHLLDDDQRSKLLTRLGSEPQAYAAGGDCPNVMVTLALLGTSSAFSGKMGEDEFGKQYEARLAETGVVSNLSFGKGHSGSSIIMVHADAERTMATYLGMCQSFGPNDVSRPHLMPAEALFFTGYLWDTPSQKEAVQTAIGMAQALDKIIAFDAADPFAVGRNRDDFLNLLDVHVDIAFANHEEAKQLFGEETAEQNARRLAKLVSYGAVKTGADGAYVLCRGEIAKIPAFKVAKVVDTTGAGDSFAAGFLHGLYQAALRSDGTYRPLSELSLADIVRAGKTAAFVAATVIGRTGPQLTIAEATAVRTSLESGEARRYLDAN